MIFITIIFYLSAGNVLYEQETCYARDDPANFGVSYPDDARIKSLLQI
jgi:hypothetical protein